MKTVHRYLIALSIIVSTNISSFAENNFFSSLKYEINAGINIGGAAPLPLPAEIRKINHYNPNLNLKIEALATKWFAPDSRFGVAVGIGFENKGMQTGATVKNYGMTIIQDGKELSGRWTGRVSTDYSSAQLCIPVLAKMKINEQFSLSAGPYVALALNNSFGGYVSDGYLREGDPTGDKIIFEGETQAPYDFDDELRLFQWGMRAGVAWGILPHLNINANLSWGCNDIFKSSFKTVTFNLYPIYFNVGFGYAF